MIIGKWQHTIDTPVRALAFLQVLNERLAGYPEYASASVVNDLVIKDDRFLAWPASEKRHQAYEGGLVVHTAQVVKTALAIIEDVPEASLPVVFTAGVWHDFAKTLDYEKNDDGKWVKTEFHESERHLVRSYADFRVAASIQGLPEWFVDRVSHAMLAHHGRREWGSPVEPGNAEAWALHAADMLSAQFVD